MSEENFPELTDDLTDGMAGPIWSAVDPPVSTAPDLLPTRELHWRYFELLIRDLAERERALRFVRCYGRSGQEQFGIDVYGVRQTDDRYEVLQARNIVSVSATYLRNAVKDYDTKGRRFEAATYFLCVACGSDDTAIDDELKELRKKYPFEIEFWDRVTLSRILRPHGDLVERYFGPAWRALFCTEHESGERARATLPVSATDALLLGPIAALNLQADAEHANDLSDPDRALAKATLIAERLEAEGYGPYATRWSRARSDALLALARPDEAFDIRYELAVQDLERDAAMPVATLMNGLDLEVDERRATRRAALRHVGEWWDRRGELAALRAAVRALVEEADEWAARGTLWHIEAALTDRDVDEMWAALDYTDAAIELTDDLEVRTRLQVAKADVIGEDVWGPLRASAIAREFPGPAASFVCGRAARWLAWNSRLDEARVCYRRALELASDSHLGGDARVYLRASHRVSLRLGVVLFDTSATAAVAGRIGDGSFLSSSGRTSEATFAALADGRNADAHNLLWRRLSEARIAGDLEREVDTHRRLGDLYSEIGERAAGIYHLTLGGEASAASKFADDLPRALTLEGLQPEEATWNRAAVYAVVGSQGDLMSADEAQMIFEEVLASTSVAAPMVSPVLPIHAHHALGAIVPLLDTSSAARAVQAFEPLIRGNQGTAVDEACIALLAGAYRAHPELRGDVVDLIAALLQEPNRSRDGLSVVARVRRDSRDLVPTLASLADDRNETATDALVILGVEHPSIATLAVARADAALNRERREPGGAWGLAAGYGLGTPLLAALPLEQRESVLDHMLYLAGDEEDLAGNRANAVFVLGASASIVSDDRASTLFAQLIELATDPRLSEGDQLLLSTQHALSRFRVGISPGALPEAALRACAFLARGDEEKDHIASAAVSYGLRNDPQRHTTLAHVAVALGAAYFDAGALARADSVSLRRAAVHLLVNTADPSRELAVKLACDSDRTVRREMASELGALQANDAALAEMVRGMLEMDPSVDIRLILQGR